MTPTRGRPTKYTPERAGRVLEALRNGQTRTAAAAMAGVDIASLTRWCANYATFATNCAVAEGEAEARFAGVIAEAAKQGDWKASEAWLKRRRRGDWGDQVKQDVEVELHGGDYLAELERRLDGLAAARGTGGPPGEAE